MEKLVKSQLQEPHICYQGEGLSFYGGMENILPPSPAILALMTGSV